MPDQNLATVVKLRKLSRVEDFDSFTWDDAVVAAVKARELRDEINGLVHGSYGEYVARLSMCSAVEYGDLRQFAADGGINYNSLRQWRSKYLESSEKREYKKLEEAAVEIVDVINNGAPEAEPVVIIDSSEPVFRDMFSGEEGSVKDLTHDEKSTERRRAVLKSRIKYLGDEDLTSDVSRITVLWLDGSRWGWSPGNES